MKRIIFILFALPISLLISCFSGLITVWTDYSTEATVGATRLKGVPIWFYEQAPGISIMSSWHPDRFLWNTGFWITLSVCIVLYMMRQTKRLTTSASQRASRAAAD